MRLEIDALPGLPEITAGADLSQIIREGMARGGHSLDASIIVVVSQKIVSKAEGALVDLRTIHPSPLARSWAEQWGKDARLIELILTQSRRVVKMDRGVLITETRLGFICANAGVDQSNVEGDDFATVLPSDPDASARRLRETLGCGAVIVSDTFGRPWREGLVDIAIGVAGMHPLEDYRGRADWRGRKLAATIMAVADQLAAAAGILMRKAEGLPVVLVRGLEWQSAEASARPLIRVAEQDLFR
jgi:coenzyme F420-0:L-glutamate ligase/coenzyme F420-1:gamma-L-glutamate ligase